MTHDPDSRLIEDILTGDVDPNGAEARARLMVDADLDEKLKESLRTQRAIEQSGEFARMILNDEHDDLESLPGADRVGPTLERLAAEQRPRPTISLVPRWAAAAAILIVGVGIGLVLKPAGDSAVEGDPRKSGANPTYLGSDPIGLAIVEGPRGTVDSFAPFRPGTTYEPAEGWQFQVRVHDARRISESPIAEGSFGFGDEWSIPAAAVEGIASIYWRVTIEDASGVEVDHAEGQATLRDP